MYAEPVFVHMLKYMQWTVLVQVFCGHEDLNDDDPHEYGVNLLHNSVDRAPHDLDYDPPASGASPPWLVDDLRFVACDLCWMCLKK